MPLIYENIIAPKTKQILRKDISRNITNRLRSSSIFRKFYFFINKNRNNNLLLHYEGVSRIKYFISFIKEDYEIYSTYYPNKLEFIDCTFSSVDQYVAKESADFVNDDANNVLLGNSNTPENNHVDAMFKFKDRLHENQKVYTILSYGPDEYYKKKVIKEGQKYLGKSFVPVLGFLERTEYIQMLKTCSVGVFYHYRQQAMGNIIAMLYLGSRIYMSSKSPAYRFLKRNGIFVFDLDKEYEIFGSDRLPLNDVLKNREILESIFSKDKVIEDLRRLTKTLKR